MDNLKKYNDRIYISSVLCDLSFNFYSTIYNISLLPTILGSSLLTIINTAEIPDNVLKIINISINGLNTIVLALINSYKINDRITLFKNHKIKFTKLNHICESLINSLAEGNENDRRQSIENVINEYDKLQEEMIYQYPNHIKNKIIKKYGGKMTLPNSLEVETSVIFNAREAKADFINQIQEV